MSASRILIVDDDPYVRRVYGELLRSSDLIVDEADTYDKLSIALFRCSYDAILLDLSLGGQSGFEALPMVFQKQPFAGVFILTSSESIETAVECLRRGAKGYLTKNLPLEKVEREIQEFLQTKATAEIKCTPEEHLGFRGLVGRSHALVELKERIERVKNIDSTVLILGESGTGKEVVARCLHEVSNRRKEKFCAINCGAIPDNLLESELFGHKRGAFTDAKLDKKGLFQIAGEGTVLLDEIGDLPMPLQTKLLRVLQEKQFTPLGSHEPIAFKARVLCATHKNLALETREGRFRQDLFFRINVIVLQTPALRERAEDIPILVNYFLELWNKRYGRTICTPRTDVMSRLVASAWPGNIRELSNSIERAVALSPNDELQIEDLFQAQDSQESLESCAPKLPTSRSTQNEKMFPVVSSVCKLRAFGIAKELDLACPMTEAKESFERVYLVYQLEKARGNISNASRSMGRYRADIYRLMEKHGLASQDFRLSEAPNETTTSI